MLKIIALSFAAASCCATAYAQQIPRTEVPDVRVLLLAAIKSPTGSAYGVLVSDSARQIARTFSSSSSLLVDVTTERRFQQAGCSRLKVRLHQDGIVLPGSAAPQSKSVDIGINYCADGTPPKSLT